MVSGPGARARFPRGPSCSWCAGACAPRRGHPGHLAVGLAGRCAEERTGRQPPNVSRHEATTPGSLPLAALTGRGTG